MKFLALGSILCALCGAFSQPAEAIEPQVYHWGGDKVVVQPVADAPADHSCDLEGLIQLEGRGIQHSYPNALPGADGSTTVIGATGKAAANLNCGNWNFQGVLSGTNIFPYQYSFGNRGNTTSAVSGAGEVDVFWRDPNAFMVGVGVNRNTETEHNAGFGLWAGQDYDLTWNFWDAEAFAELYPNDQITLGMTGFYGSGDAFDSGSGVDFLQREYGGSAYVRYYPTPDLRLSLRGNVTRTDDLTANETFDNWNAVVTADYKIPDSAITVFGGLRYGANSSNSTSSFYPNSFVSGLAGVQLALGPRAKGTLLEQDRNGVNWH